MNVRGVLIVAFLAMVAAEPFAAAEAQTRNGLHDMVYVSPTWGYSARWYGSDWTVDQNSSQGGQDSLWLADESGNAVGFEGRSGYGGDARACLDDQFAIIQGADSIADVAVVEDDQGHPQKYFHPWRSWILFFAAFDNGGEVVDHIVYVDCRTLVPDDAVLIRFLIAPAATFSIELERFDVLNAALPRSAWNGNPFKPLSAPGLDKDFAPPPLLTDSIWPWLYPDDPALLASVDGFELGMMTQVDGDSQTNSYVVMIENSGEAPLTVDPDAFTESNDPTLSGPDPDLLPIRAEWDDGAPPGSRTIRPGTSVSLTLAFPPVEKERMASFLVYRDNSLDGGYVRLDCFTSCGYGGGGTRPKLRLSR